MRLGGDLRQKAFPETNADHRGVWTKPRQESIIVAAPPPETRATLRERDAGDNDEIQRLGLYHLRARIGLTQSPARSQEFCGRGNPKELKPLIFQSRSIHTRKSKDARFIMQPQFIERRLMMTCGINRNHARTGPFRK